MTKGNWLFFFFLLALLTLFSGCDSDEDDPGLRIKGVVTAEEPVEGATVSISTLDGELIEEFTEETQSQGTFLVSVPLWQVLDGYRVAVTGGAFAESGIPFTGTLRAVVDHETMEQGRLLHVGFASTLLAGYRERHPGMDTAAAEAAVADFLDIPETQHLLTDLFFCQGHFSRRQFAEQAAQYGGLDYFVEMLLDEIDSGQQEQHAFDPPAAAGPLKDLVLKPFLKGLAKGAGGEIGGRATGWVMDKVFGDDGEPSYPTDPAVINAIAANGDEIARLRGDFEDFAAGVKDALKNILTQSEKNEYTTLVTSLATDISLLNQLQDDLWFIATHQPDPDDPNSEWESTARELRDETDFTVANLDRILRNFHQILYNGDPEGAIEKWGFLNTRHAAAQKNHKALFDQFLKYAHMQATALNLLLEKRHHSQKGRSPEHYVDLYMTQMEKQADVFLKRVEGMMAYAQSDNFARHPYKDEWGATVWGEFYTPSLEKSGDRESETLAAADTIAGSALGMDQAVTVRLAWVFPPGGPWFKDKTESQVIDMILEDYSPETDLPDDILWELPGGAPSYAADKVTLHPIDLPQMENLPERFSMGLYWFVKRYTFASIPTGRDYGLRESLNPAYPSQRAYGNADLFHPEYLKQSIPMEAGKFRNLLVMTYAHPIGPLN